MHYSYVRKSLLRHLLFKMCHVNYEIGLDLFRIRVTAAVAAMNHPIGVAIAGNQGS